MTRRRRAEEPVGATLYNFGGVSSTTFGHVFKDDDLTYGEMVSRLWALIRKEKLTVEEKATAQRTRGRAAGGRATPKKRKRVA